MPTQEEIKLREFINNIINENKLLLLTIADLNKQIEQLTKNKKEVDDIVGSVSEDSFVDISKGWQYNRNNQEVATTTAELARIQQWGNH